MQHSMKINCSSPLHFLWISTYKFSIMKKCCKFIQIRSKRRPEKSVTSLLKVHLQQIKPKQFLTSLTFHNLRFSARLLRAHNRIMSGLCPLCQWTKCGAGPLSLKSISLTFYAQIHSLWAQTASPPCIDFAFNYQPWREVNSEVRWWCTVTPPFSFQ